MICPEVLRELPIPRPLAETIDEDGFDVWANIAYVYTDNGENVIEAFRTGTQRTYQKLRVQQITALVSKEKSPSYGSQLIYDGRFPDIKKAGVGVATAYFIQQGMTVYPEETRQLTNISF